MQYSNQKQHNRIGFLIIMAFWAFCHFQTLIGQGAQLDLAKQLATEGQYMEADKLYKEIATAYPNNIDAMIGSAYNHSWNSNIDQAKLEFEQVLRIDPGNKSALVGLGYALAWAEDYHNAKHPFWQVLRRYPMDEEGVKGLAYVYLWQGKPDVAINLFEKLSELYPDNPEYKVGLAYGHLLRHETKAARELIQLAIGLVPGNFDYEKFKKSLDRAPALLEFDVWGGYSKVGDDGRLGLRSVSVSAQLTQKVRAYFTYDNTLTLDNYGFLLNGEHANTYFMGSLITWNKKHLSRIQYGIRDYTSNGAQSLLIGEHVVNLKSGIAVKGGGLFGFGSDLPGEWMLNAGVLLPISMHWQIEPTYYLSSRSATNSIEHRVSLRALYHNSAFDLSFGGTYGNVVAAEAKKTNIYGAFLNTTVPLSRLIWLQGTLQYEKGIPVNMLIASLGIKIRLEK